MTTLVAGWIIVMLAVTLYGACADWKDISLEVTIIMLAGVVLLGSAAILSYI